MTVTLSNYTFYLQIFSTKEALLMEIARVGRISKRGWRDLAGGLGSYSSALSCGTKKYRLGADVFQATFNSPCVLIRALSLQRKGLAAVIPDLPRAKILIQRWLQNIQTVAPRGGVRVR